jgi:hypothetical protein
LYIALETLVGALGDVAKVTGSRDESIAFVRGSK